MLDGTDARYALLLASSGNWYGTAATARRDGRGTGTVPGVAPSIIVAAGRTLRLKNMRVVGRARTCSKRPLTHLPTLVS